MDDTVDDAPSPPNPHHSCNHRAPGSMQRPMLPARDSSYPQTTGDQYADDEDDLDKDREEDAEEEEEEEESSQNAVAYQNGRDGGDDDSKNNDGNAGEDDDDDDDDDGDGDDDDDADEKAKEGEDGEDEDEGKSFDRVSDDERHLKKRKLKNLISSYEFAARVAAPPLAVVSSAPKSFGGRSPLTDWTEHETFVLLDAWGDKFLQLGRKSLRSEEWQDVAEKVSKESKIDRTDTQCRNRLDTLKKKYKKEKMRLAETRGATSKWVHFKKMEVLMSSSSRHARVLRGSDSRDCMFSRPKVYLNHANGSNEMKNGLHEVRNSSGNSESSTDENDSDGLPPKRLFRSGKNVDEVSSFRLLADSIQKFSEIYEKIEKAKRKQMVELEKMRMDYTREVEKQKRKILERAHAAIAKIRRGDDEETDASAENVSG